MTRPLQTPSGLNAYRDRLPVAGPLVSLGEGNTPLLPLPRIGRRIGLPRLCAKLESINPTGSYKDRIAAVSISLALERGHRGWIATSSGNGGLSLAAYGARAGLPGILFTVANMPREKLLPLLALGVAVHPVEGVGDGGTREVEAAVFDAVRNAAERHNLFLGITAHAFNPDGMRGVDTIAYEIHRDAPDAHAVYVPSGGGGLAAAIARGLGDQGATTRVVVCQPQGCASIVRFLAGDIDQPVIDRCDTEISGLQLPGPPDGLLAAKLTRNSGGWGTAVADGNIRQAQTQLAQSEGIFVEPASACALAAAIKDREGGRLNEDNEVVLVLTGSGLKDLNSIEGSVERPAMIAPENIERQVEASLSPHHPHSFVETEQRSPKHATG